MSKTSFKGQPVRTSGTFPSPGQAAPDFTVVREDLSELRLADLIGRKVVLNIFPSVDTPVCALQLKTFAGELADRPDVAAVFVSMDLPFALSRFCAAEGVHNAITCSDFRHRSLGSGYGVRMEEGPLAGLYARATLVLDENHIVRHAELVPDVGREPDYGAALRVVDELGGGASK